MSCFSLLDTIPGYKLLLCLSDKFTPYQTTCRGVTGVPQELWPLPADLLLASCFCISSEFPALSSPTGHHTASMHSLVSFLVHSILHPLFQFEVYFSEATHSVLALDLCSKQNVLPLWFLARLSLPSLELSPLLLPPFHCTWLISQH